MPSHGCAGCPRLYTQAGKRQVPDGYQGGDAVIRTGDEDADILINTQNFTRVIEDTVREYPDQWFWIHQRWKTKPWQVAKTHEEEGAANK